jgi:uncharacterized protein YcaQ
MEANDVLRRSILEALRERGPLLLREFEDRAVVSWRSAGWTAGRNVSQMLEFLSGQGRVLVAGRRGQKLWDLPDVPLAVRQPRPRP